MPQNNQMVQFYYGTQQEFDNISNKDNNIIYFITDAKKIYVGNDLYTPSLNQNLISVCTSTEYENMITRTSLIYLLLDDTELTIKDANDNLLNLTNGGGSSTNISGFLFNSVRTESQINDLNPATGRTFDERANL